MQKRKQRLWCRCFHDDKKRKLIYCTAREGICSCCSQPSGKWRLAQTADCGEKSYEEPPVRVLFPDDKDIVSLLYGTHFFRYGIMQTYKKRKKAAEAAFFRMKKRGMNISYSPSPDTWAFVPAGNGVPTGYIDRRPQGSVPLWQYHSTIHRVDLFSPA